MVMYKKSSRKVKLPLSSQEWIPNNFQIEAFMEKKKVKCSSNFKLLLTMKSTCKLLNVAICSKSFFRFVSNLVDLLVKHLGR